MTVRDWLEPGIPGEHGSSEVRWIAPRVREQHVRGAIVEHSEAASYHQVGVRATRAPCEAEPGPEIVAVRLEQLVDSAYFRADEGAGGRELKVRQAPARL